MNFEWDSQKARTNEDKHAVSFLDACTAFDDDFSSTVRDPDHFAGEARYLTFGVSTSGRALVVSHTDRGDAVRIISARAVTPKERRAYEDR